MVQNLDPAELALIRRAAANAERARIVRQLDALIAEQDTVQKRLSRDGVSERFAFHGTIVLGTVRRLRLAIAEDRPFTAGPDLDPALARIPAGTPVCDGYSVGAIITDPDGRYLTILRVKPPSGRAFVAGHIDEHGNEIAAVIGEVAEEAGFTVTGLRCVRMTWVPGRCRRHPSPMHPDLGWGHQWFVFEVDTAGVLAVDESEVQHPRWVTSAELAALAARTVDYAHGRVSDREWSADPGLEPAWLLLLASPGLDGRRHLDITAADQAAITDLAMRDPYPPHL